ncbi:MAG: dihydropteroate synthase [Proteobacteria bacterium]|nr:dihydropteroate synthase [Pseudomonadota bacterium]
MFIPIAENLQPFDKNAKEIFSFNKTALSKFLSEIEKKGIKYIDFNPGPIKKEKEKIVKFFIEGIEEYSNLNIVIDSTDAELIELAINFSKRMPIINGFSLEQKKTEKILPLAEKYNLPIIGLLMSESYIPKTLDEKLLMAEQMIGEAETLGIRKDQIILDPIIAPLGWEGGLESNKANLEFIKEGKNLFKGVRFLVGISNLTTKSAGGIKKSYFQNILITLLWSVGIDFIMLDAFNMEIENTIKFLRLLESGGIFSFAEFSS